MQMPLAVLLASLASTTSPLASTVILKPQSGLKHPGGIGNDRSTDWPGASEGVGSEAAPPPGEVDVRGRWAGGPKALIPHGHDQRATFQAAKRPGGVGNRDQVRKLGLLALLTLVDLLDVDAALPGHLPLLVERGGGVDGRDVEAASALDDHESRDVRRRQASGEQRAGRSGRASW